jgi:mono/diheme cytochrome c family protein
LQGAPVEVPPPLANYAPALAGGPANFTDEQFVAFLQTGVRPDGSHPRPPMPPYRLNEADARAVAAYIATLPPAPE